MAIANPIIEELAEERFLTAREVQTILGISRGTAYRLIEKGVLPSIRFGGNVRVPLRGLHRWLAAHSNPGAPVNTDKTY